MAQIAVLSKEISELIAAGEVIERPASVIKEVVENAIDAGAKHVTVEIKHGGTTYMRITDDGCGMAHEDVPTAFLRHATSKITAKDDLENIHTLGFRGEALASVSAVAKVSVLTKRRKDALGTEYRISGSVPEDEPEQTGCPDGTTIVIRDLFYNVPVRRRFMKKDVTEANAVSQIVQKIALSHPEIAFQMIRDNRMEFCTDGSGDLYAAIYAIYGKEFAHDMIAVDYSDGKIKIMGYACKPLYAKSSRSFQNFFINGRYVRSKLCSAALQSAYEHLIMTSKFPSCVLMMTMNPSELDVNVHPTKAEVRFTNEHEISDAIYFAIKNALLENGLIYEFHFKSEKTLDDWTAPEPEPISYEQPILPEVPIPAQTPVEESASFEEIFGKEGAVPDKKPVNAPISIMAQELPEYIPDPIVHGEVHVDLSDVEENLSAVNSGQSDMPTEKPIIEEALPEEIPAWMPSVSPVIPIDAEEEGSPAPEAPVQERQHIPVRVIGEIFQNYILAEAEGQMLIFDKHAAHERVLFERLKISADGKHSQMLMTPQEQLLSMEECDALRENDALLSGMGFGLDVTSAPQVRITSIPTFASGVDAGEMVAEIAHHLVEGRVRPQPEYLDDLLHTIACKAAIKAHDKNALPELQKLAEEVYNNQSIRHCPHGRPVLFVISKHELEKQFRRV